MFENGVLIHQKADGRLPPRRSIKTARFYTTGGAGPRRFESEIAGTRGYPCDVGDAASVERAFTAIRSELGEVGTLLYNAGSGVFADVEAITPDQFEQAWRVNAYGALLCAREVIPGLKARRSGNIIFIGATALRRGGIRSAAFAPAKAAQRSLAEIDGA